jgi:F420-non-reducing hydrogenase iron-sulfur subunit
MVMSETFEPKIVAFVCNWCAYAGADLAGVGRMQYPTNIRLIRLMCTGRINHAFLLNGFLSGMDGVMVSGWHIGDCHYLGGNEKCQKVVEETRGVLRLLGADEQYLRLKWISASEGGIFADEVRSFTELIKKLGRNPLAASNGDLPLAQEAGG